MSPPRPTKSTLQPVTMQPTSSSSTSSSALEQKYDASAPPPPYSPNGTSNDMSANVICSLPGTRIYTLQDDKKTLRATGTLQLLAVEEPTHDNNTQHIPQDSLVLSLRTDAYTFTTALNDDIPLIQMSDLSYVLPAVNVKSRHVLNAAADGKQAHVGNEHVVTYGILLDKNSALEDRQVLNALLRENSCFKVADVAINNHLVTEQPTADSVPITSSSRSSSTASSASSIQQPAAIQPVDQRVAITNNASNAITAGSQVVAKGIAVGGLLLAEGIRRGSLYLRDRHDSNQRKAAAQATAASIEVEPASSPSSATNGTHAAEGRPVASVSEVADEAAREHIPNAPHSSRTVDPNTRRRIDTAKQISGGAVGVSRQVMSAAVYASSQLSDLIASRITDSSLGRKIAERGDPRQEAYKNLTRSSVAGLVTVYDALEAAGIALLSETSVAVTDTVGHNYGSDHADLARDGMQILQDGVQTIAAIRKLGVRALVTSALAGTTQQVLAQQKDETAAEQQQLAQSQPVALPPSTSSSSSGNASTYAQLPSSTAHAQQR